MTSKGDQRRRSQGHMMRLTGVGWWVENETSIETPKLVGSWPIPRAIIHHFPDQRSKVKVIRPSGRLILRQKVSYLQGLNWGGSRGISTPPPLNWDPPPLTWDPPPLVLDPPYLAVFYYIHGFSWCFCTILTLCSDVLVRFMHCTRADDRNSVHCVIVY